MTRCFTIRGLILERTPEPPADAASTVTPLPAGFTCPKCRYDLRGSTSANCPECGEDLEPLHRGESLIPWERRRELGFLKAYFKTVWLALFNAQRLCTPSKALPDLKAAWWFRFVTTLWIVASYAALGCAAWLAHQDESRFEQSKLMWSTLGWTIMIGLATYYVPGLFSHYFQSKQLPVTARFRALVIGYYAWGVSVFYPAAMLTYALRAYTKDDELSRFWSVSAAVIALMILLILVQRIWVFAGQLVGDTVSRRTGRLLWYAGQCALLLACFGLISSTPLGIAILLESLG